MLVFLNGDLIPADQARVSVFDRGFMYGDGLFETLRICNGRPFAWRRHWERLERGAKFLNLRLPFEACDLRAATDELVRRNEVPEGVLRLTVSRGVGPRGYSPREATQPTVVISVHSGPALAPENLTDWDLVTSSVRLRPDDPLAVFKTCNRLPQIMARAEADSAGAQESLLRNLDGWVVEGAASNLFWIQDGTVCTPPLESGVLPGVTRALILDLCVQLNLVTELRNPTVEQLHQAAGVFMTLSSIGIAQGISLDGKPLRRSDLTAKILAAYATLLRQPTIEV